MPSSHSESPRYDRVNRLRDLRRERERERVYERFNDPHVVIGSPEATHLQRRLTELNQSINELEEGPSWQRIDPPSGWSVTQTLHASLEPGAVNYTMPDVSALRGVTLDSVTIDEVFSDDAPDVFSTSHLEEAMRRSTTDSLVYGISATASANQLPVTTVDGTQTTAQEIHRRRGADRLRDMAARLDAMPTPDMEALARRYAEIAEAMPSPRPRPRRSRPNPHAAPVAPRRSNQEPAWRKYPMLINIDKRQSGRTTKLLKEMLEVVEDTDCIFIAPTLDRAKIAMNSLKGLLKIQNREDFLASDSDMTVFFDGGHSVVFKDFQYYRSSRMTGSKAVFIDDLDECLKSMFSSSATIVSLSWKAPEGVV